MVEPSADRDRSLGRDAVSGAAPTTVRFGGAATERHRHDLEDHIDMLRALDEQRRKSAMLRDYGIKALEVWFKSWLESELTASRKRESELTEEERNKTEIKLNQSVQGIYSKIIYCFCQHGNKTPTDINTLFGKYFDTITSSLTLETIDADGAPVWLAAKLLQAFVATQSRAYSTKSLLCYYYVVRELYTADAPGWSIGGARGRANWPSEESPYITSLCARAILSFIESQEATTRYIGCLRGYLEQTERLKSDTLLQQTWKDQEQRRINLSCYITLQQCAKSIVLPLDEPRAPQKSDEMPSFCDCDNNYDKIRDRLKDAATSVKTAFDEAIKEIDNFWRKKFPDGSHKKQQYREQFGHERALGALTLGKKIADDAEKAFYGVGGKPNPLHDILEEIEKGLRNATLGMREVLLPVANYFETVLDRELTTAMISEGDWHPVRMAIAASSLVGLDKSRGQDRKLLEAVFRISQGLSDRGVFPVAPPEHQQAEGMATVRSNEAILAHAELIRRTPMISLDEGLLDLVKKMLLFFEDTRAHHPGSEKETALKIGKELKHEGWRRPHFHVAGSRFDPTSTLGAINALAAINQMLDEKINQVILEHFSVKRPEKDLPLDMDDLFYPDYGLVASRSLQNSLKEVPEGFKKSEWPEDFGRKESVAITLQRMRAHVQHASLEAEGDSLCSVALHGPPGTGKTTLVEALAKTCGVPLVEVTPSDIIIGGEEAVERRARTVFEALTLLTRVVILFDEFDPVLWKRDPEQTERSVFTFLTPGMLPKLKDLRRLARKRSSAFVLSSNLIGCLDEAAVREGRFDKKVGIYPPDPLSRAGRLLNQLDKFLEDKGVKDTLLIRPEDDLLRKRVAKVVERTKGGAMERLAKPGWFSAPDSKEDSSSPEKLAKKIKAKQSDNGKEDLKPFYFIFCDEKTEMECEEAGREAYLKDPIGDGPNAILEFGQWWWIDEWEKLPQTDDGKKFSCEEAPEKDDVVEKLKEHLATWKADKNKRTRLLS